MADTPLPQLERIRQAYALTDTAGAIKNVSAGDAKNVWGPIESDKATTLDRLLTLTNGQVLIGATGAAVAKAAITAGAGVAVTNGAGSITISVTSGGGVPQGASFPTTPAPVAGDLFMPTVTSGTKEAGTIYRYDGTRWLSTPKVADLKSRVLTATNILDCNIPVGTTQSILINHLDLFFVIPSTPTQDATNFWAWSLFGAGLTGSQARNSQGLTLGSNQMFRYFQTAGEFTTNPITTSDNQLRVNITQTGAAGSLYAAGSLVYQLVGS